MPRAFLVVVLCAVAAVCYSQKSPLKFGDIPMEDLTMTSYPGDSSASAVVLTDFGKAYISFTTVDVSLIFERHVRIKILKKDGLKWADVEIPLFDPGTAEEKVTNLKARTYTLENGKVIETSLSKDGIFKEKFNRYFNVQKFTLPSVKEGSVIEYSYTIMSDFVENFPNWQFQRRIPTRRSEYWAVVPDFFVMERYMQGYVIPTVYDVTPRNGPNFKENLHHWVMQEVPAFKEEPYMACENDYISKINFAVSHITVPGRFIQEIMGSWEKLSKRLLESDAFGKTVSGSGFLKSKVVEVIAGKSEDADKLQAIVDYVKANIEWDGTKDYLAYDLKEAFERKKGSSGDINLALASMLDKAGLIVDPVLLSTRDHGVIRKQYPMQRQLNYVVCRVTLGNTVVFVDATEKMLPYDVLPERCLNGEGWVVSAKAPGWTSITTKAKSKTVASVDLGISPEGGLVGKVRLIRSGYDALALRKQVGSDSKKTEYLKDFSETQRWDIDSSRFENIPELQKEARETHYVSINDQSTVAGDLIYVNPFVVTRLDENPFKLEKREYPVDFASQQEKVYVYNLTIPEGYVVDELPKSKAMALPEGGGRFTFSASVVGNVINVTSNFQINRPIFGQPEYPQLREFYAQVVAKQAEQIVLKKK